MRFAYADPPYIGQAERHYKEHKDYAGEVDHKELIDRLVSEYPDGWALSLSSTTLKEILALCPDDVRVMSWVKPFHAWKNIRPSYAWEPVIVSGGRKANFKTQDTRVLGYQDWVSVPISMETGLAGVKPERFCIWLFEVLNVEPGDTLDDLFPGSGIVGEMFNWYLDIYEKNYDGLKQTVDLGKIDIRKYLTKNLDLIIRYKEYLQYTRKLSANSIKAYMSDLSLYLDYIEDQEVNLDNIEDFINKVKSADEYSDSTKKRIIISINQFAKFFRL